MKKKESNEDEKALNGFRCTWKKRLQYNNLHRLLEATSKETEKHFYITYVSDSNILHITYKYTYTTHTHNIFWFHYFHFIRNSCSSILNPITILFLLSYSGSGSRIYVWHWQICLPNKICISHIAYTFFNTHIRCTLKESLSQCSTRFE